MPPHLRFQQHLDAQLTELKTAGLYKTERVITSPQGVQVQVGVRLHSEIFRSLLAQ